MPRSTEIPPCPDAPNIHDPRLVAHLYQIELVTPMFGGGVSTRVNDPSFPIRPTAIRGQLQFWWRATLGAQYATREKLREEQTKVWGGVVGENAQASKVQIQVELLDRLSEPKVCAVIKPNHKGRGQVFWEPPFQNTALSYAIFPFQGKPANQDGPKVDLASCIHKATFRLTVISTRTSTSRSKSSLHSGRG